MIPRGRTNSRAELKRAIAGCDRSFFSPTKALFLLPALTAYSIITSVMDMTIRPAEYEELDRVNELRRQLHVLHANGKPEIFKPGFPDELRDYLYTIFRDPMKQILVTKPENPFKRELDYLDIDEFGVDEKCRRQGIAAEMIRFIRDYAKSEGFDRLELNMWEFNHDALAFYEAVGFSTYRRYMEMKL